MRYKLRPIQTGLLACVLAIAIFVPEAIAAQALNYNVTSGTRTIAAGAPGASLSARVGNSSNSLNFSLCFTTGYGSSAPITPDSPSFSSGYTTVTLAVPASNHPAGSASRIHERRILRIALRRPRISHFVHWTQTHPLPRRSV